MAIFGSKNNFDLCPLEGPIGFFFSTLLNLSSYGYYKTTLSTKKKFLVLGAFSVLKLKMAKIYFWELGHYPLTF